MKILIVGRKHIAKAEDIVQALTNLGHEVDYLLLPSFHYAAEDSSYTITDNLSVPTKVHTSKIGYYWGHYTSILSTLKNHPQFDKAYDLLIGIDSFETMILSQLRSQRVDLKSAKLVYYAYDYYFYHSKLSTRYLFNRLDQKACRSADMIWNVNPNIGKERAKRGFVPENQITVPLGIAELAPEWELAEDSGYLFMGNFKEGHNLRMMVDAFIDMPDKQLYLIGKGNLLEEIEKKIQTSQAQNIHLLGFVSMEDLIKQVKAGKYRAGLAVYEDLPEVTCADPGKIKDYLGLGLPVITTNYNPIADTISGQGWGKVLQDGTKTSFIELLHSWSVKELKQSKRMVYAKRGELSYESIIQERIKSI